MVVKVDQALRTPVEIKSHTPGRMRLSAQSERKLRILLDLMMYERMVMSYSISTITENAVLYYNDERYNKEQFVDLLYEVSQSATGPRLDPCFVPAEQYVEEESESPLQQSAETLAELAETFAVVSEIDGRARLHHGAIGKYPVIRSAVEHTLINLDGVTDYTISALTSNVLIIYEEKRLHRKELLQILNQTVINGLQAEELVDDSPLKELVISTTDLVVTGLSMLYPPLIPVAVFSSLHLAYPVLEEAYELIVEKREINNYKIIDAALFTLCLVNNQVFSGALVVWGGHFSEYLVRVSSGESSRLLTGVFGKQRLYAWKLIEGEEVETSVSELEIGDHIVVHSGDQVPVDGTIISGEGTIDQQTITGEGMPTEKEGGDPAYAMTTVMSGSFTVRVEKMGDDTNATRISQVIEESMGHETRIQSKGEEMANTMVTPTLTIVGLTMAFKSADAALAILNCDYGSGIRRSAPISMMATLSMAAKHGIIIKNPTVLETLYEMDAVIFDKTGTLTHEVPTVGRIVVCDDEFSEEELLRYVAAAEQRFTHPIAASIVEEARRRGLQLPKIDEHSNQIGYGVRVVTDRGELCIGSLRFMEQLSISIGDALQYDIESFRQQGHSVIFAALDDRLIGMIELMATPREEAKRLIDNLKKNGVEKIYMISGDHENATRDLAQKLGIDHFSEVLPEQKGDYVEQLQDEGYKVGMVGDGVNDAIALSRADFSISLRGASEVATNVADVIFLDGDLKKFDYLFRFSEELRENVKTSAKLIVLPNIVGVLGAMVGPVGMTTSLFINGGANFLATLNALRPYNKVLHEDDVVEVDGEAGVKEGQQGSMFGGMI